MHQNIICQTPRLIIREYTPDDLAQLYSILSDPITMSFWPAPFDLAKTTEWLAQNRARYEKEGFGRYAVILKENQQLIGSCGLINLVVNNQEIVDLGYIIYAPFWQQGYAVEAAEAVKHYAFTKLALPTIYANMPFNHIASQRVAEKIGMHKVDEFFNKKNRDIKTYLYRLDNQ